MKRLILAAFGSLFLLAVLFLALGLSQKDAFAFEAGRAASMRAVSAAQPAPGLLLTVTLSTVPDDTEQDCPGEGPAPPPNIEVRSGSTVYYCYIIKNTGNVTLTSHTIEESIVGSSIQERAVVPPEGVYSYIIERDIAQSTTNQVTWRAFNADQTYSVTATALSTVTVTDPNLNIILTVGREEGVCADTQTTTVPAGGTAYFCLEVENTGDITLTRPTFVAPVLIPNEDGLSLNEFILPPGDRQTLTGETLRAIGLPPFLNFGPVDVQTDVTLTVRWETSEGSAAVASASATALVGNVAIDVQKTLSVNPDGCTTNRVLTVAPDQDVYYCLVLRNPGEIMLSEHSFEEPPSGVQGTFRYNLAPGGSLTLTQATITSTPDMVFSQPPRLGPFQQAVTETRWLTLTSSNTDGFIATDTTSTTLNVSLAPLALVLSGWRLPNPCVLPPNPTQTYNIGDRIWYCVQVRNNSSVALTNHRVTQIIRVLNGAEEQLVYSVTREFAYTIQPGASLAITNSFFTTTLQPPQSRFMGPFTITVPLITTAKLTNTLFFTSSNPAVGFGIANRAVFPIFVNPVTPTPTPTFTVTPGPTDTPTPEPTFTPLGGIPTATPTPTPTAISLSLPPTPTPTTDFSVRNNVSTPEAQFISPIGPPTPTPIPTVDSPLPTPTFTSDPAVLAAALAAEAAATETILAASFTSTATATDTPTPTATATGTATPVDTVTATATQRPIESPTTAAIPDGILLFSRIVDVSIATAGWIWFAAGSLIFFTVAGIVAGLSFRQQEQRRYRLDGELPKGVSAPPAGAAAGATTRQSSNPVSEDDDHWPASLP